MRASMILPAALAALTPASAAQAEPVAVALPGWMAGC